VSSPDFQIAAAKAFGQLAEAMVFIIETSDLSRESQNRLREELAAIPVEIVSIAESQTKPLRRSKNGKKPEEDEDES
jgi:hypothetical protein